MSDVAITGKGRRWLGNGHPWIYRDDLASADAQPGDLVRVVDPQGRTQGFGLYSASSRIAVRMVSRGSAEPGREHWAEVVTRAVATRERLGLLDPAGACRLIAGDADRLPGLVVDRYADVLVLQSGTAGADRLRDLVVELVSGRLTFPIACVVDRSDASVRKLEGLEKKVEIVRGELPAELVVREDELVYEVDVLHGHKTGHYLDQRDNRRRAGARACGTRVLDAFCYDGLFGIRAALGGAREVVCLDQSEAAGERVRRNAERNRVGERVRFVKADALDELRALSRAGERFGLVVVDPPAFAKNRRELAGAERGYVEVNRRALELCEPGGTLVSASCSYNVRPEVFVDFLAKAAALARRDAYLEELAGAAPDHPALLTLPESSYLKCAFVRVESSIDPAPDRSQASLAVSREDAASDVRGELE
jgi:23S rRNA (cytosine1962-C5)-methyltransferase